MNRPENLRTHTRGVFSVSMKKKEQTGSKLFECCPEMIKIKNHKTSSAPNSLS
jgi:hypothetical protein